MISTHTALITPHSKELKMVKEYRPTEHPRAGIDKDEL
jgi:hypothetical protein